MQNRYERKNRRKYSLKVHIVLVTKYRKKLLVNGMDDFLKERVTILQSKTAGTSSLWRQTKTICTSFWDTTPQKKSVTSSAF